MFCSPFDEALAHAGPAGVFLPDTEGALRFQPNWTRDAWGRAPGPHAHGWTWTLLRDRDSGFVLLALVTSPTLITEHPRLDVRVAGSLDEARAMRAEYGNPPVAPESW
ncbi:MAG: hypothetical protein R3F61_14195 [Myxococcota bacterium]